MKIIDIINLNEAGLKGIVDVFAKGFEKGSGKAATGTEKVAVGTEKAAAKAGAMERLEVWAQKEMAKDAEKVADANSKAVALQYLNKEVLYWLSWANLIGWFGWYKLVAKPRLDRDYKEGRIKTPEEYQAKITWLRGKMVSQIILPKVAIKLANWKLVRGIANRLPALLNAVGAKNSAAIVSGVSTVATTSAAYAAPVLLQQLIAESIGDVMFGVTGVAANAADKLYDYVKGQTVSTVAPTTPSANNATQTSPGAAAAKQDIDATSTEPVFGQQRQGVKWADTTKKF
jgi:hypothetical protein